MNIIKGQNKAYFSRDFDFKIWFRARETGSRPTRRPTTSECFQLLFGVWIPQWNAHSRCGNSSCWQWHLTFHDHIFNSGLFVSVDFFNFRFVSKGFSLSFDQVFVQGLARTNRSVAQYYLRTSNDDDVYVTITEPGGDRLRVKFANLLFMNLNYCVL